MSLAAADSTTANPLRYAELPSLPLECGEVLRAPLVTYRCMGRLNAARDNAVLVLHALTGSSDAAGDWWNGLIGPGAPLDTARYAILAPDLIGSCHGSAEPRTHEGRFPPITTRDQARAVGVLVEQLGITRVALVTGGSLGGMVALEFVASFPGRSAGALVLGAPVRQSAWGLGWNAIQRELVTRYGNEGLALARRIAMLTYRAPLGLERRFGRRTEAASDRSAVAAWLAAHGERLSARFDPASYVTLLDAMDAHDVGRGRRGPGERLRASGTSITAIGLGGDQLYPPEEVQAWARETGCRYAFVNSEHGHDAFLLERDRVGVLLREALEEPRETSRTTARAEVA